MKKLFLLFGLLATAAIADITISPSGSGGGGSGEANTASNLGNSNATVKPIWFDKNGSDLRFFSIEAGSGVTVSMTPTSVVFSASGGGGSGTFTAIRSNSAVVATNVTGLLYTNSAVASPVQFNLSSNAGIATVSATVANLSGSGNVVASNSPTMNNATLNGSTIGGTANFTDGSIGTLSTTDLTVEGPASIEGAASLEAGATISGQITVHSNLVFTPRPFVLGTTNWFASGERGMIFTNSHTALGLTNYFATNIASGQTMTWEIFVGIGSTAMLPQFIASDYTSGRIEGLASNCVNIVTIRRTPMGTNVSVRTKEFTLTATKRIGFFTNLATMTITAMATNDASTVAGVGGANTNFTLQAMGPAFVYTDAGTTNQNVVAIMGAGTGHENFVNIATNRTATPRTYSVSSVTNNWIAVGSLTFPQQVTNALYVAYTVRGTNVFYALRYIANPAP